MRIGCDGDSNTVIYGPHRRWCKIAAELMPRARIAGGGSVPTVWLNESVIGQPICNSGGLNQARTLIGKGADIVIVALGTNDLAKYGFTPKQVVACYEQVEAGVRPRPFFAALIPPVYPPATNAEAVNIDIDSVNAELRKAFGNDVIDFHDGFTPDMFFDGGGLHLNDAGQRLRAERAVAALVGHP